MSVQGVNVGRSIAAVVPCRCTLPLANMSRWSRDLRDDNMLSTNARPHVDIDTYGQGHSDSIWIAAVTLVGN